jgi:hypothetical protein
MGFNALSFISGPITAGVLRGTISCFLLFGDTINTDMDISYSTGFHMSDVTDMMFRFLFFVCHEKRVEWSQLAKKDIFKYHSKRPIY